MRIYVRMVLSMNVFYCAYTHINNVQKLLSFSQIFADYYTGVFVLEKKKKSKIRSVIFFTSL